MVGSDAISLPSPGVAKQTSSFAYSFTFLPHEQREAMKTVYAFCRTTDDLVDNDLELGTKIALLTGWREELERALKGEARHEVLNRLCSLARRFGIPVEHFHELIRGVEMDLVRDRYETFADLKEYCYLVASSVGLMTLRIFGSRYTSTREYAVNLGIALQLTNIIRDVGVDAASGRIYLPREDLRRFGCSEQDILDRRYTPQFKDLMAFEAQRAEEYFEIARRSLAPGDRKSMFAAKIMERIYYHTLRRIRRCGYNVFDSEIRIPTIERFLIAVKYWLRDRVLSR